MRILIIGCSGSGKSTLARKLGALLTLPVVHLDRLYWEPGWIPVTEEVFDARLLRELAKPDWILDGNFDRTLPLRLAYADWVIRLELPRRQCLWRALGRVWKTHGKVRPDMGAGCPERFDGAFLRYIWQFEGKHRESTHRLLDAQRHAKVLYLHSSREVADFLKRVEEKNWPEETG